MKDVIVNDKILKDLYDGVFEEIQEKAKQYQVNKQVEITKVIYENENSFEVHSQIRDYDEVHRVYIKVRQAEIENLTCNCDEYMETYASCAHILATISEFANHPEYITFFAEEARQKSMKMKSLGTGKENYRVFKQLIHEFYPSSEEVNSDSNVKSQKKYVKLESKVIYDKYTKLLKLEVKIGDKQFYKIKSLPEFYNHMLNEENYRYGSKLEFIHTREAFEEESIPLLNFVLKYAEIIKYANETTNGHDYYEKKLVDNSIVISNTGLDELFDTLNGKKILFETVYEEQLIELIEKEPNIKFMLEEISEEEYQLKPNIDVYEYEVLDGKEYIYLLIRNKLYRCSKKFRNTILKFLEIYRKNFTKEIVFKKEDLPEFFSFVMPRVKKSIDLDKVDYETIKPYIPEELYVKVYLDYDKSNFLTADIKFCYGEIEFNPLLEESVSVARDVVKEDEVLTMFRHTGFMLDTKNARLILVQEEAIYQFLSSEIENYMQRFEILATEGFKQKEIKEPKISSLGVKIENNLLQIDFNGLDFDIKEIAEIMQKYKLKRKYHRLKDGSFLKLEENETVEFLENLTEGIDVDFKEIEKGELKLPVYRSLYLDRILGKMKAMHVMKEESYKTIVNKIENRDLEDSIQIPSTLNVSLRPYQQIGYKWLKILDSYKLGGILADDMGLGKTIQLLAVICSYVEETPEAKPTLVVCPSSLTLNWQNEVNKFAPTLKSLVISGTSDERRKQIETVPNHHIVITSYDLLKRDIEEYKTNQYEFKYIIADEAQYIKNNNTQNAKAIKEVQSEIRYALTGTPIENSLSELWSIFDFIMPGYLFSYHKFKEIYELPIVREEDPSIMNKLKMLIEPFVLRRIKSEVLTELPDKMVSVLDNEMQEDQLELYMSYLARAKKDAMEEIKANGFEKSQMKILALLMRLRQICCHPALFIENYEGESSKLNQCMEIIKDGIQSGHKILLFSGYTSMFQFIEKELEKENIGYLKLTGQTKVGERMELVNHFNEDESVKVFLISLKAGGTGLNLIGADMVIHYDPWWNLSAENQATDRTYRIGQKRNVQVYKLITKNSIEEKIYELQQKKAKLADTMLTTGETFINRLSKQDIMDLFE